MANKSAARVKKTRKSAQKKGNAGKAAVILLLLVLALVAAVYLFLCMRVDQDRMLSRTYIDGVDVSDMTAAEADAALQANFAAHYESSIISVLLDGETYAVSLWGDEEEDILWLSTGDVIASAMERGHGAFLTRGYDWLTAQLEDWTGNADLEINGGAKLTERIRATGIDQVDTAVETTYSVGESSISISKGSAGVVADLDSLQRQIVELVESEAWPALDTIDCATLDSNIAALDIQNIYNEIYVEPVSSTLDRDNDYAIIPSVTGVSFDLEAAQAALEAAEPGSQLTVDLIYTEPDITTADMEANLFRDVLGSYTTSVSGSSGRKSNVKLSAQFCDGTILLPGDVFSYNDTVGQRTKARGFSEAPAYLNGETVQEVGGGICQTSSTLYAACLYSNLEIVARTNHTYASSYIGLGLDATVSWGGPEFKFCNNTDYPIKIDCTYSGGKLTVKIYGTKTDDITVKITSKVLETIPAKTGEGSHHKGYKVQTYRELYENGSLISSTEEAYSYYRAS